MTDARRIATFIEAQAAERGAASNTQLAYARDLGDFLKWCASQGTGFLSVGKSGIEAYLCDCDDRGLARSTRAR